MAISIAILVFGLAAICLADHLTLNISDGAVKGTQLWSIANNSYYAFYSIRYGQPPTGALRFQTPVVVEPWTDVFDATVEGNNCYTVGARTYNENEDCLNLNVYTPKNPSEITTKLPVLFYIHGGGFYEMSGQSRGGIEPDYFMDTGEVVMVSINYRLGPFGFFSTGDSVIPGNAGLKDQLMALKWVQKNIATFGGDASRVTIFGESAGGASVGYLIMNTAAAGLFSGGILASGTALCPWAYQRNQTEITFKTASFINSHFETNRDSQALWQYLQNVTAKDIDAASERYTEWATPYLETALIAQLQQGFFYAPVVEVSNPGAFLTEKTYEILASGNFNKVPILIGTCAEEGLINLNANLKSTLSVYDQDTRLLVPQGMHIADEDIKKTVGDAIKKEYSPSGDMQNNLLSGIQYSTDQVFQKSLIRHAELQSKYSDVYFYVFSYSGKMGGKTATSGYPGSLNVSHTEEMHYIWQRSDPKSFPEADQLVHQRFIKIWTNFITSQNPTPTLEPILQDIVWPKLHEGNLQYVDIGADLNVKRDPKDKYIFWKNLFQQYGVEPCETY